VAYRKTRNGLSIIASGTDSDVRKVLDGCTPTQLSSITLAFPEDFDTQVATFGSQSRSSQINLQRARAR
jgi:hypothetical protein